jgi:folate-dependent phosphoribosylglycinamide formyltransferase PurN
VRTALICHSDNPISFEVLPAWLSSFSEVVAVVVISERSARIVQRIKAERRRSGWRLLDVLAFRLYYRLRFARRDHEWLAEQHEALRVRYGAPPEGLPVHHTTDPNSEATRAFLEQAEPDLVLARCKTILRPEIFTIPVAGTVVVHPGICPEYRNAHGCFWALSRRDLDRVGATLLQIDEGVDTGPVLAYYHADFDEVADTHVAIQHKVVFENLDAIAEHMQAHHRGALRRIDTTGRDSAVWGQPRLTDWLKWKRAARRAASERTLEGSSVGGMGPR